MIRLVETENVLRLVIDGNAGNILVTTPDHWNKAMECVEKVNAGQFTRVKNAKLISIYTNFTTRSALECCQTCARNSECIAINYCVQSDECQLSQTTPQTGRTAYNIPDWNVIYRTGVNTNCIDNSCFVIVTNRKTWDAANTDCQQDYGGHLAHVQSLSIHEFLTQLLTKGGFVESFWLGGNDIAAEGFYEWTDGTLFNNGFTNWEAGQPDNFSGSENCLEIKSSYRWNDNYCTVTHASICEYPAN